MTNKHLFAAIVALSSASAFAGFKNTHYVTLTTSGTVTMVYGAMGTARNSADNLQHIGCDYIASGTTSGFEQILCTARTAEGETMGCMSTDPRLLNAVSAITAGAYLQLSIDTTFSTYKCSRVSVTTASRYAPPQP